MINDLQQELLKKIREGLKPSDLKTENTPATKPHKSPQPQPKATNSQPATNNNQSLLSTELLLIMATLSIAGYFLLIKE